MAVWVFIGLYFLCSRKHLLLQIKRMIVGASACLEHHQLHMDYAAQDDYQIWNKGFMSSHS